MADGVPQHLSCCATPDRVNRGRPRPRAVLEAAQNITAETVPHHNRNRFLSPITTGNRGDTDGQQEPGRSPRLPFSTGPPHSGGHRLPLYTDTSEGRLPVSATPQPPQEGRFPTGGGNANLVQLRDLQDL